MITIALTLPEIYVGAFVGIMRQITNIRDRRTNANGLQDGNDWQYHIEGALAEKAVAKHLDVYWSGSIGNLSFSDVSDKYEVRSGAKHTYSLIIHPKDKDDKPFILVTGLNGTYQIHGWMYGAEGKLQEYWSDPVGGRPAFFVPSEKLHSMDTLPSMSVKGDSNG